MEITMKLTARLAFQDALDPQDVYHSRNVLHFRPCAILAIVSALFSNTTFAVNRLHPLAKVPNEPVDPKSILLMSLREFSDGEELEISTEGEAPVIGALALKTALENMDALYASCTGSNATWDLGRQIYDDLVPVVDETYPEECESLLHSAKRYLTKPESSPQSLAPVSHTTSALLAERLHNATVEILPYIGEYFDSALILSFRVQKENQEKVFDFSSTKYSSSKFNLLACAPPAGTRVTIKTSGENAIKCGEAVAGVVRLLPVVDEYIRSVAYETMSNKQMISGVLEVVRKSMEEPGIQDRISAKRQSELSDLLNESCIIISDEITEKDAVLRNLAALQEAQTGVPVDKILTQAQLRERSWSCFENGIAIPHARVDCGPKVSLCIGVYSKGVKWVDDHRLKTDNRAYVVLLFVSAADAPETYSHHLAQACRIITDQEALRDILLARDNSEVIRSIYSAEVRLNTRAPAESKLRVILVESVADMHALRRDRMIRESPRMEGIYVEYIYVCSESNGDLEFDAQAFEKELCTRIDNSKPDFVLLHTGMAFHRFREPLLRIFSTVRGRFPNTRFGYQEKMGLDIGPGIFSQDPGTIEFQRTFFVGLLGV
jgi:mannitol/fructose-specific phosphotransferase system IIA component (Ntr-type)